MGNSQFQSSDLKIYIETQKQFFNSGSTIQGVVFIQALNDFQFDALYIRVQGDQWCQWFEGSSKNRRKYLGNQNFYMVQHILHKFSDRILSTGKYAYPFSLQLSQNIPGSFSSKQYDAKISYKLIAYFANYQQTNHQQMFTIPLIIRQPFRQQQVPVHGQTKTNPKSFGCFSAGEVGLYVWFQKNVCFQDQGIKIQGRVNNTHGKSDISSIKVQLVQYTFVSANNGVWRTYKKVQHKHLVNVKCQVGKQEQFDHEIKIPIVEHQTAISTLVANYFRLEVSIDLGIFSKDAPIIISPLFILKKSFKLKSQNPQKDINPQQYRINKLQFFRAPEYWFKKNRNLDVINFRMQDIISNNQISDF